MDELIRAFRKDQAVPSAVAKVAARERLIAHIADAAPTDESGTPQTNQTEDAVRSTHTAGELSATPFQRPRRFRGRGARATPRQQRMARDAMELLCTANPEVYMASALNSDTRYDLNRLRSFGAEFVATALRGEVGHTSISGLAKSLRVPPALVNTFLQQPDYALPDGTHRLNFVAETVLRVQARELLHERYLTDRATSGLVWVRTQPTYPLEGIHASYRGRFAYGLQQDARAGAFDSIFATYATPAGADSINFGGLIHALEKDVTTDALAQMHLSPLHRLSLERPTAAMFAHAGAAFHAARAELPAAVAHASLFIFLQGRFEGPEEDTLFLARPTRTICLVDEPAYQSAARLAFGDAPDLIVQAEGPIPDDRGLEASHHYVRRNGSVVDNATVRSAIRGGRVEYFRLDDDELIADSTADENLFVVLLPGELRARRPRGGYDAGQALLVVHKDGHARWFSVLNRGDGSRAWRGDDHSVQMRVNRLASAFALLDRPSAGEGRPLREQVETGFHVAMRSPSGRENVWRLAAAVRQAQCPPSIVTPHSSLFRT